MIDVGEDLFNFRSDHPNREGIKGAESDILVMYSTGHKDIAGGRDDGLRFTQG